MPKGKKFIEILKGIAPTAVAALGGPYAGLAYSIMKKVLNKEGASDQEIEDEVVRMAGDPEQIVKLRQIESDLQTKEKELDLRFEEARLKDVQDARLLGRTEGIIPQIVMSALFITGYFVILGLFFSDQIQYPDGEAFFLLIGVLTAAVPQILQFWFGSSEGSKNKTKILANGLANGH